MAKQAEEFEFGSTFRPEPGDRDVSKNSSNAGRSWMDRYRFVVDWVLGKLLFDKNVEHS